MKRIMVIGCCGSGKSTFSKQLKAMLNLELIHLDQYYWKPHWVESDSAEWSNKVQELANKEAWIMDGNYAGTMKWRIARADTIIYLDRSTLTCLWRVIKRTIQHYGKSRPDMPEGCKERFDFEFLKYVATFNFVRKGALLNRINVDGEGKRVEVLRSNKDIAAFLKELVQ